MISQSTNDVVVVCSYGGTNLVKTGWNGSVHDTVPDLQTDLPVECLLLFVSVGLVFEEREALIVVLVVDVGRGRVGGDLVAAAGLEHTKDLRPIHFSQRTSTTDVRTFAQLYPTLRPGELLDGTQDPRFREAWAMARADSFQPAG